MKTRRQVLPVLLWVAAGLPCGRALSAHSPQDLFAYPQYQVVLDGNGILNETVPLLISKAREEAASSPADSATVHVLRTPAGQAFLCTVPVSHNTPPPPPTADDIAQRVAERERGLERGLALLDSMKGGCLFQKQGYFTYSFCYGSEIRQFHEVRLAGSPGPSEDPNADSYTLGQAPAPVASTNPPKYVSGSGLVTQGEQRIPASLGGGNDAGFGWDDGGRYLSQKWEGGTICDKTMMPSLPPAPSFFLPGWHKSKTFKKASVDVVVGTLSFAGLGGVVGSTVGVVRNVPAIPLAFATALNTGIFSFTFFSVRQYVINPLFTSFQFHPLDHSPHTHNLVATSLAGISAGTLVSYFARGSRGALRSGLTLALGCTLAQTVVNEADLARIKTLAWSEERSRILAHIDAAKARDNPDPADAPPTYSRSISSPVPSVPSRETFSERSDRLIGGAVEWMKESLERVSPLTKMDDGDYKEKLAHRLEVLDREKGELAQELEKLEAMRRKN